MDVMEPLTEDQVISNLSQVADPADQYYAAWWLGKMRSRHPEAVPLLLQTLDALQQTPVDPDRRGVALNAIRALGEIGGLQSLLTPQSTADLKGLRRARRSGPQPGQLEGSQRL